MAENVCPLCGEPVSGDSGKCSSCGQEITRFEPITWIRELSLPAKIALLGVVIFIPSFLFNLGSQAMIWGLSLLGIGFLLFAFKIGV